MASYFDFGNRHVVISHKNSNNPINNNNYIIIFLDIFKLFIGIFFIISSISGFIGFTKLINLYKQRRLQLINFYVEIIKKKNEFSYVSSDAFKEVRLRKLYGAYKKNEKLIIFTNALKVEKESDKARRVQPKDLWRNLLTKGVTSITE